MSLLHSRGSAWVNKWGNDNGLKIFTEENGTTVDFLPNINNANGVQIHEANLRHFVDCLINGTEPIFKVQEGVDMIKILEGMYKSAETGREVIL